MAILAWAMMGIALWHFTVFFDERLAGGIIAAFLACTAGSLVVAAVLSGFDVPSRDEMNVGTALQGVPGALLAILALYLAERRAQNARGPGGAGTGAGAQA